MAVVRRAEGSVVAGPIYPVTIRVRLVAPYYVRLRDPIDTESIGTAGAATLDELLGVA